MNSIPKRPKLAGMVLALSFAFEPCSQASFWGAQPTGPKRVVVDKSQQELRAYQGNQLVFQSRISSGKRGRETPSGHFRVQSKSLMHRSRLYDNAPMPYSVQFAGNYFIHGFKSVPRYPASHGCIRLPIGQAEQFYQWADRGTPVDVVQ